MRQVDFSDKSLFMLNQDRYMLAHTAQKSESKHSSTIQAGKRNIMAWGNAFAVSLVALIIVKDTMDQHKYASVLSNDIRTPTWIVLSSKWSHLSAGQCEVSYISYCTCVGQKTPEWVYCTPLAGKLLILKPNRESVGPLRSGFTRREP